jgi:hypothetical protein
MDKIRYDGSCPIPPMAMALNGGGAVLVDEEDYRFLSQWVWRLNSNGYAGRSGKKILEDGTTKFTWILMHRVIMKTPAGLCTDHVDGDKLNNQRANLRICTVGENNRNVKKRSSTSSKYKGVNWHGRNQLWHAWIRVDGRSMYLGGFKEEEAAATAYNMAALREFKQYASLNFIPARQP